MCVSEHRNLPMGRQEIYPLQPFVASDLNGGKELWYHDERTLADLFIEHVPAISTGHLDSTTPAGDVNELVRVRYVRRREQGILQRHHRP